MRKALVILPLLILAGCGGASSYSTMSATTAASKHAVVKTRHGKLGTFLVDGSGRTLYLFLKDTGRRSMCSGSCAQAWPPLTTKERPEAEGGAKASMLSTTRRANGARQVLYNGHPLYRYAPDTAAGQTGGQGVSAFGARWYVVGAGGRAIRSSAGGSAPSYSY
jgi:predicted lipoprotein with Yx(FWY)xxD motif